MSLADTKENYYSSEFFIDNDSDRMKKVRKILKNRHHSGRVLDIGCGIGNFIPTLQEQATEVRGIEISKKAVAIAKKKGLDVSQLDIDDSDLSFHDNSFDTIFCGEFIEHIFDPDHLLDEIHRTLKPGGIAIITTPNLASYLNRIVLIFGFQPYLSGTGLRYNVGKFMGEKDPCPHLILFTHRALKELLLLHNFSIHTILGAENTHAMPQPFKIIDRMISKVPSLASNMIFVVEKK